MSTSQLPAEANRSAVTPAPTGGVSPVPFEVGKNVAGYAAAVAVTAFVVAAALHLWHARLDVPLYNLSDNLMAQMFVQNILESGGVDGSARLGAPGVMDMRDFPIPDVFHIAAIRLLGCVSHNSAVVLNLYYLVAFPLTAVSAYFVLRRLRCGRLVALVPSVLYACQPYHFLRVHGHLFLAAYYLLPLMIWVMLRVYLGRSPFLRADADGRQRWRFFTWEAAGAVLLCIAMGLSGIYYAFFSCFLLLAAGIRAAFRDRRWAPAGAALLLILFIVASVGAALAPSLLYQARHGKNPEVAAREPAEADLYALNITEMLLPLQGHRVPFLARLQQNYFRTPRQPTGEAICTALGTVGSLGFLYLMGRFLWRRRDRTERVEDGLAYLTLAATMLGTVGGLGACFAFYVTPMIRCYNRLSIFIAFLALAGLFIALQRLGERYVRGRRTRAALACGLMALLVLGALDQTSAHYVPPYHANRAECASDADFGRRIEAALPAGAMVYQMPYAGFPEYGPVEQLGDYELLRPFLHTRTLRWSYGAVKGRETSRWQAGAAALPLPETVERLAFAGFGGVYLDRAGFADNGAATESELTRLLGAPLVSTNGRQSFFDMTDYVRSLRGRFSDGEWQERCDEALHPLALTWGGSFSALEPAPEEGGKRWCGARGELHVGNPLGRPRRVVLSMRCLGWDKAPARLAVDGDLCHRQLEITPSGQSLEMDLTVTPGDHVLTFACAGPRMQTPTDPREIVFRVAGFRMREEAAANESAVRP